MHALHDAGIHFAVTSGRPPRGMEMLVEPLSLAHAARRVQRRPRRRARDGRARGAHRSRTTSSRATIELLESFELSVWVYRGADWLVRDPDGPHVARESHTVQFEPTVVDSFDGVDSERREDRRRERRPRRRRRPPRRRPASELGDHVSASRSQPYYLDVTHPQANKGGVVRVPVASATRSPADEIATIGDMPNDVLMFAHSGLSIAMGNADREVQRAARRVTTTNDDDGFANAVERFILGERS